MINNYAIILASGVGSRSGLNSPKQFFKIDDKTILEHSVEAFVKNDNIKETIIVCHHDYLEYCNELLAHHNYPKPVKVIAGGATRQESSYIGLASINDDEANVLIHDAVRPFLNNTIINHCIKSLKTYKAVCVAIAATDTIIEINPDNTIKNIPNRSLYRRGQTPQCFKLSLIKFAHQQAISNNDYTVSDDCGLILRYSQEKVFIIDGDDLNLKITTPLDIALANEIFKLKNN